MHVYSSDAKFRCKQDFIVVAEVADAVLAAHLYGELFSGRGNHRGVAEEGFNLDQLLNPLDGVQPLSNAISASRDSLVGQFKVDIPQRFGGIVRTIVFRHFDLTLG